MFFQMIQMMPNMWLMIFIFNFIYLLMIMIFSFNKLMIKNKINFIFKFNLW